MWKKTLAKAKEAGIRAAIQYVFMELGVISFVVGGVIAMAIVGWTWFSQLHVGLQIFLTIVVVTALPWLALGISRIIKMFSGRPSDKYLAWQQEHDDLAENDRIRFFALIDNAYDKWRVGKNIPEDIHDLLKITEFPEALPLQEGKEFAEWDARKTASPEALRLIEFAQSLYPEKRNSRSGLLTKKSAENFDKSRRRLAKFWTKAGRRLLDFKDLSEDDLASHFPAHLEEIRFLTYLEWALARRLRDSGPGKDWMFKLYNWAEDRKDGTR